MIKSYDEWSKLKRVIIGRAENYKKFDCDESFILFFLENIYQMLSVDERTSIANSDTVPQKYIDVSQRILAELMEDLEEFCDVVKKFGVSVVRPSAIADDQARHIATPNWDSFPTPALNVRDQAIIFGETIVETAPHVRARLFENDHLQDIFYDEFEAGANWVCMPRPTLRDGVLDGSFYDHVGIDYRKFLTDRELNNHNLNVEMVIDGAQFIRFGEDIIVNLANENHSQAFKWISRNFGNEFNFHLIDRMADNHIDSILLPLRPGLILIRDPKYIEFLPDFLKKWDFIVAPEPQEDSVLSSDSETIHLASKYVDINLLSLDEETVVVNKLYPELIKTLEGYGFNVLPVRHRHRRVFSGGFHCFSLDLERASGKQSYK